VLELPMHRQDQFRLEMTLWRNFGINHPSGVTGGLSVAGIASAAFWNEIGMFGVSEGFGTGSCYENGSIPETWYRGR